MREYGKVHLKFWTGRARDLSDDGKLFLLYLLSSPHSNAVGCYRLPKAYIADDLGWPSERVAETVTETVSKGFTRYDDQHSWVWLPNYFEHNPIENPNVGKNVAATIETIPKSSPLFSAVIKALAEHRDRLPEAFRKRYANHFVTVPEPFRNIEPSQSQAKPEPESSCAQAVGPFERVYTSGCEVFAALATANTSAIHQWLAAGCDPEMDVIPELLRHAKAGRAIRSWSYFTGGIIDAKTTRLTPPEGGSHGTGTRASSRHPTKADRGKAAVMRAAVAGGFAPEPG